ncbi:MAG: hypothetical protein JWN48_3983, partial [Myxococcaceae bacterium]|nr:hypothetical protein [Myxococcaceae bacterium]
AERGLATIALVAVTAAPAAAAGRRTRTARAGRAAMRVAAGRATASAVRCAGGEGDLAAIGDVAVAVPRARVAGCDVARAACANRRAVRSRACVATEAAAGQRTSQVGLTVRMLLIAVSGSRQADGDQAAAPGADLERRIAGGATAATVVRVGRKARLAAVRRGAVAVGVAGCADRRALPPDTARGAVLVHAGDTTGAA